MEKETLVESKASSAANCGFVFHVIVVLLAVSYVRHVFGPFQYELLFHWEWVDLKDSFLNGPDSDLEPPSCDWSVTGSVIGVVLFFGAPMLYGALNALTVVSVESTESLMDSVSKSQGLPSNGSNTTHTVSEIYDVDVSVINDLFCPHRIGTDSR